MEFLHTNTVPHRYSQFLALHSGTGDGQDYLVDTDSLLLLLYAGQVTHQLCQSRGGEFPGQWGRWCGPSECRLLLLLVCPAVLALLQLLADLGLHAGPSPQLDQEDLPLPSPPHLQVDPSHPFPHPFHLSLSSRWTHITLFPIPSISPSAPGGPISPFFPSLPSLPSLPLSTSTCGQVLEPAGSHRRWSEMCLFLSDLHPEWRRG